MEDVVKVIQDFGIYGCLMVIVIVIGLKYIPQVIELKLQRLKDRDYMLDSFKAVVENNSQVIKNNSEVIKLNSDTIKNYTDNAWKLEHKVDDLTKELQETNKNIEIIKERR